MTYMDIVINASPIILLSKIGILMRAKKNGLIDKIETEIEALRDANMYLSDDLVKRVIDISNSL